MICGTTSNHLFLDALIILSFKPHFEDPLIPCRRTGRLHLVPKLHISTATRAYDRSDLL